MNGFEMIQTEGRMATSANGTTSATTTQGNDGKSDLTTKERLGAAVADNFGNILQLASSIVEIKRMEVASKAVLDKLREDRKMLLAEAEAYALKKRVDTNDVVQKMQVIRMMMQDFYAQNNSKISSEDFTKIITSVVDQMGRISNGL